MEFPFLESLEASEAQRYKWGGRTAVQIVGVPQTSRTGWGLLDSAQSELSPSKNLSSGSFFHPQPPSLLILLLEPGSERKVLAKET